jgi:hypothetical protein
MANGSYCPTKSSLSPAWRWLVELMQEIQFGAIENLHVQDGEPDLNRPPRVQREIVFGKENSVHPAHVKADFTLKAQHIELIEVLDRERKATVDRLVVQHGLPVRMTVADVRRVT